MQTGYRSLVDIATLADRVTNEFQFRLRLCQQEYFLSVTVRKYPAADIRIYTFLCIRRQSIRPVSTSKGSYFHNFITAFAVTLSNPLIIFLFVGLFARFAFVSFEGVLVFEAVTGYLAIAGSVGVVVWNYLFVNKVRTQFNLRGIWILNRIIGGIVMVVSALGWYLR